MTAGKEYYLDAFKENTGFYVEYKDGAHWFEAGAFCEYEKTYNGLVGFKQPENYQYFEEKIKQNVIQA